MSEAKIVPIAADILPPASRAESVVDALKDLLAQAERGEIVGIAYTAIGPVTGDVTTSWNYEGRGNGFILIGAVARLLYRMNVSQD